MLGSAGRWEAPRQRGTSWSQWGAAWLALVPWQDEAGHPSCRTQPGPASQVVMWAGGQGVAAAGLSPARARDRSPEEQLAPSLS